MTEQFGDLIKRLRIEKGLTIEELASKTGFSSVQIRNIEANNNKPRVFNLKKLSEVLGCSYEYLYDKANN
jgi:transcriptional regulator with XRE-family HTH domain